MSRIKELEEKKKGLQKQMEKLTFNVDENLEKLIKIPQWEKKIESHIEDLKFLSLIGEDPKRKLEKGRDYSMRKRTFEEESLRLEKEVQKVEGELLLLKDVTKFAPYLIVYYANIKGEPKMFETNVYVDKDNLLKFNHNCGQTFEVPLDVYEEILKRTKAMKEQLSSMGLKAMSSIEGLYKTSLMRINPPILLCPHCGLEFFGLREGGREGGLCFDEGKFLEFLKEFL